MSWSGGAGDAADARMAARIIFEDPVKLRKPRKPVTDHPRHPQPDDPPEPGAQWNELSGQWERWDEATEDWVPVGDPGAAD
jgi:hypothetical protein